LFPAIKRPAAVGAPVVGFGFAKAFFDLKERVTYFTTNLLTAFAVVEIEKLSRRIALLAAGKNGYLFIGATTLDRFNRIPMGVFKRFTKLLPIESRRR